MKKGKKVLFTASLALALTLTLSCSSDPDDHHSGTSSSGGGSSSSGISSSSGLSSSSGGSSSSVSSSSVGYGGTYGSVADEDGKTYRTVKIGGQTWMADNLDYHVEGSLCYENDPENCEKYGRLYNWDAAVTACPSEWHLPSYAEWNILVNLAGSSSMAGGKLKAISGWSGRSNGDSGNGTDEFGFSALPGGNGLSDGSFNYGGTGGYWWSATELDGNDAARLSMSYNNDGTTLSNISKSRLYNIRCLKDED